MIAERLTSAKIVFGLTGDLAGAIDRLCARSQIAELGEQFHSHPPEQRNERYSYLGAGIAVPHLRVDNLAAPELILGLAPGGLAFNDHQVSIVLLLATPAERPAEHLQLLQRIAPFQIASRLIILEKRIVIEQDD